MDPLLTIIIVNYNTGDMLERCLVSIQNNTICSCYEIIVIDNASSDDSCKKAQTTFPSVKFILNQENLGFSAANNQGIMATKSRYVLLLNPDTVVTKHAIDNMLAFIEEKTNVAALGCKLLNPDGSLQPSCSNSFLSIGYVFWRILVRMFFLDVWLDRIAPNTTYPGQLKLTSDQHKYVQKVKHIVGAALMVRRDVIEKVGLLDIGYFLYLEETDWCYRMQQLQLDIYYIPHATIFHFEGESSKSSNNLYFNEREVHIYRGKLRFFKKHRPYWEYVAYQHILIFIIGLKLVLAIIAWLIGFKRNEMNSRVQGYQRILRLVFEPISTELGKK